MKTLELDRYVVDTLMPDLVGHDKRPSALLVYLFLWAQADARGKNAAASLREIAEGTGLSKRGVQDGLRVLTKRKLVARSQPLRIARFSPAPSNSTSRPTTTL